jgi:hypothetical protein
MSCSGRSECRAIVEEKRPALLNLLGKFSDGNGGTMADDWLTPEEKRIRRARLYGVAVPSGKAAPNG